jgi:hypothetical protein
VEVQLHSFFTSVLDGGEWSASRPGRFTPRERAPGTVGNFKIHFRTKFHISKFIGSLAIVIKRKDLYSLHTVPYCFLTLAMKSDISKNPIFF